MNTSVILLFLSLISCYSNPNVNNDFYVLNPLGAELYEEPELSSRVRLSLNVGEKIVALETLETKQSKKVLEGFYLGGNFIKVTQGDKTGYLFTSDLTQIKPQIRKVHEGIWIASILGKENRAYENKRMVELGDQEYEVIDKIIEYEHGVHKFTAFDGCFNEKYNLQLSLSEVFHQMTITQMVIDEMENRIIFPEFIEKNENVFSFQGEGATEDLKIIDNRDGTFTLSFYSCT